MAASVGVLAVALRLLAALAAAVLAFVPSVRYCRGRGDVTAALEWKGQLAAWRSALSKVGIVYVAVSMVDLSSVG